MLIIRYTYFVVKIVIFLPISPHQLAFIFTFLVQQCRPSMICPETTQEVCGSDGQTYKNPCYLIRARCMSGGLLKLLYHGPCG